MMIIIVIIIIIIIIIIISVIQLDCRKSGSPDGSLVLDHARYPLGDLQVLCVAVVT